MSAHGCAFTCTTDSVASARHRPSASLDGLVALQAAERELRLGVTVLVRVWARGACALLPWRRVAGEMKAKPGVLNVSTRYHNENQNELVTRK